MPGFTWTDLVDGFKATVAPLNLLGQKVQQLDNQGAWQTATLVGGWTGTFRYRQLTTPGNTIEVFFNIIAGTKANGTTVTTLPVGFRPASGADLPVSCDNVAGGGQMPHINITSAGVVTCWGVTAASGMSVVGFFPTDV